MQIVTGIGAALVIMAGVVQAAERRVECELPKDDPRVTRCVVQARTEFGTVWRDKVIAEPARDGGTVEMVVPCPANARTWFQLVFEGVIDGKIMRSPGHVKGFWCSTKAGDLK